MCIRDRRKPAGQQVKREPRGTVSFAEGISLEVRIDLVTLDSLLFGRLAVRAARDEMRQLDAVHDLVVGEMHFERRRCTAGAAAAESLRAIDRRTTLRRRRRCCGLCSCLLY